MPLASRASRSRSSLRRNTEDKEDRRRGEFLENIGERGFSPFACASTLKKCEEGRRELFVACAQAFGETRSTRSVIFLRIGDAESFWKISEKGASAPLRALARSCLRGLTLNVERTIKRSDARMEKTATQLYLHSSLFILHSSFFTLLSSLFFPHSSFFIIHLLFC